jgi:2-iminobutanoate/2-iminopropanoate deaminase
VTKQLQSSAASKKAVSTSQAPKPIGPYSQGIVLNGCVYTAGQGAIDPSTNKWAGGDIKQQTKLTLENIKAILSAAGSSLDKAVKVTVFLRKKELFAEMNEGYATYFTGVPPARTTVVTDLLRDDMLVEIEAVAEL